MRAIEDKEDKRVASVKDPKKGGGGRTLRIEFETGVALLDASDPKKESVLFPG